MICSLLAALGAPGTEVICHFYGLLSSSRNFHSTCFGLPVTCTFHPEICNKISFQNRLRVACWLVDPVACLANVKPVTKIGTQCGACWSCTIIQTTLHHFLSYWSYLLATFVNQPRGARKTVSVFISASLWSVCWIVLDPFLAPRATGKQTKIVGEELWQKWPPGDVLQGHSCLPLVDLLIWKGTRGHRFIPAVDYNVTIKVQQIVWNHQWNKFHRIWEYSVSTDRWCICTASPRIHQISWELS